MKFSVKDLITLSEEIRNRKLYFLYREIGRFGVPKSVNLYLDY